MLKASYAVAAFDTLPIRIRERDGARNGMLLFCLGIQADGAKDILGVWRSDGNRVSGWREPLRDLRRRGVKHISVAQGDFESDLQPQLEISYATALRLEPVAQLLRRSMSLASPSGRRAVASALRQVLRADDAAYAQARLDAFAATPVGERHCEIVALWRTRWRWLAPLFRTPVEMRPFFLAFDAASSLREKLARRETRLPLCFRSDEDAADLTISGLINVATDWKVGPRLWSQPRHYFSAPQPTRLASTL